MFIEMKILEIEKMKYLNQFNIFIMIVIFSVTASFGQGWKILTTQEFT